MDSIVEETSKEKETGEDMGDCEHNCWLLKGFKENEEPDSCGFSTIDGFS